MAQSKRIYGLIGYPVKHSFSPAMHNAAFKYLKERGEIDYDAEYKRFRVAPEDLEHFLNSLLERNIYGLNVTIPHKVRAKEILKPFWKPVKNTALEFTHREDHYVFLSGAINTIKRDVDSVECCNTDVEGFMESLKKDLKFSTIGKDILVLGCGGAGRAIVAGLTWRDAKIKNIYIYDINKETLNSAREHFYKFDFVKDKLEFISREQIPEVIRNCQLLVNASPVGMKEGDNSIIDKELLHKRLHVYDLVYNRETQLIKDAKACDLNHINGLKMLWRQGMLSFKIWTNKDDISDVPKEVMWQALSSQISTK